MVSEVDSKLSKSNAIRKFLALGLSAGMILLLGLLLCAPATIFAQEPQLQEAPTLAEQQAEPPPVINGHGTGFIPPPMDLSHLTGQRMPNVSSEQEARR